MNTVKNTFTILAFLFLMYPLCGQYNKLEPISFGNAINNPIKLEVLRNGMDFEFYADNRSFYPYILELNMNEAVNLTPVFKSRQFRIYPGRNRVISFRANNPKLPVQYKYTFKYFIGFPSTNADMNFPYLKPCKDTFALHVEKNQFYKNEFALPAGDTIYCMRKGLVTAVPDMYYGQDRVSARESLEIMHDDGTIMVYENIDPKNVFVKPSHDVYPGQPLGLLQGNSILKVVLFSNLGEGRLQSMEINYYVNDSLTEPFSENLKNTSSAYPESVITKEMSKSELRKYKKGKLGDLQ